MKQFLITGAQRGTVAAVASFLLLSSATLCTAGPASIGNGPEPINSAKNLAGMNCGAKIECITPDGREAAVATATEQNRSAAALIMG